jgi:hypothetical protein
MGVEKQSHLKLAVTTGLAWLGLAGLTDNILEWQSWFEQGVMEHWRSIKEWVIAVLLDWVPFRVQSWMIDYLAISGVVARSHLRTDMEAWREKGMSRKRLLFLTPIATAGYLFLWPFSVLSAVLNTPHDLGWIRRDSQDLDPGESLTPMQEQLRSSRPLLKRSRGELRLAVLGFIPVVFVSSTLLYRFG